MILITFDLRKIDIGLHVIDITEQRYDTNVIWSYFFILYKLYRNIYI